MHTPITKGPVNDRPFLTLFPLLSQRSSALEWIPGSGPGDDTQRVSGIEEAAQQA